MKRLFFLISILLLIASVGCSTKRVSAHKDNAARSETANTQLSHDFKTPVDKMSYSFGVETAKGLMRQGVEFNPDAMARGMNDVLNNQKLPMSDEEIRTNMSAFQSGYRVKQVRARLMTAQDNKAAGDKFLNENKTKEGVVTLPSGLQYKILKSGTGPKPADSDIVECRYRGTLIDGTEFDNSIQPDNEAGISEIKISNVIPGWREALKLMPVGSKWQIFIPPSLAYGQRGTGRTIGPYATLIFEIELTGIKNTE